MRIGRKLTIGPGCRRRAAGPPTHWKMAVVRPNVAPTVSRNPAAALIGNQERKRQEQQERQGDDDAEVERRAAASLAETSTSIAVAPVTATVSGRRWPRARVRDRGDEVRGRLGGRAARRDDGDPPVRPDSPHLARLHDDDVRRDLGRRRDLSGEGAAESVASPLTTTIRGPLTRGRRPRPSGRRPGAAGCSPGAAQPSGSASRRSGSGMASSPRRKRRDDDGRAETGHEAPPAEPARSSRTSPPPASGGDRARAQPTGQELGRGSRAGPAGG